MGDVAEVDFLVVVLLGVFHGGGLVVRRELDYLLPSGLGSRDNRGVAVFGVGDAGCEGLSAWRKAAGTVVLEPEVEGLPIDQGVVSL